ncbi:MAG: alpha/beta fold hydrolase, partial [Acidimicrobiales bacterium]|nr:alpha/beta fold hydrolase [Acidimicrobiales bacterium]
SAGETVHPAAAQLVSESAHFESEAHEHALHAFQAVRNMDEILVANFSVVQDLVDTGDYDLVVGDEAWDVDHFWHENPELKKTAYVWMTDFVGWLPMPEGGAREAELTADYNSEMLEHVERFARIRDRAIFVGDPDDVIAEPFGPGLPDIRAWSVDHYDFAGYITGFEPPDEERRQRLRARLGYPSDVPLVIATVGGTRAGEALLRKVIAAFPYARKAIGDLRLLVVCGPRIDPRSMPEVRGVDVRGYVPDLHLQLAACDAAIVQGGLTTTMELVAAGRPFLYFPPANHFEQQRHVRHRLDRYGAGRCMSYADSDPEDIADALVKALSTQVDYAPVPTDGAARAAQLIAELL